MSAKWNRLIPSDFAVNTKALQRPSPAGASSYVSYDGALRPQQGDETFPFVKDPPQLFGPALYTDEQVVVVDEVFEGPPIDVRGARHLMLYVDLRQRGGEVIPPTPIYDGSLSILPEAGFEDEEGAELWWPIGVVDATLSEDGLPEPGYSERNVFQTELVWDPRAGLSPAPLLNGRFRLVLAFDVAYYFHLRFRFGALGGNLALTSYISVGR